MSDLAEFVLARIAEREQAAKACVGINELAAHINGAAIPRWVRGQGSQIVSNDERQILRVGHTWAREAEHIVLNDPAYALARCAADRQIVEWAQRYDDAARDNPDLPRVSGGRNAALMGLRFLALPYADHPDYDESWKP